jgi:hypothetical protein
LALGELGFGLAFQNGHQSTFRLKFEDHIDIVFIFIKLEKFEDGGTAF